MERLQEAGRPLVAIDYAHTPDALDKALLALQPLARQRGGKALVRVRLRRRSRCHSSGPLMAAVAWKKMPDLRRRSPVTTQRSEKPENIIMPDPAGACRAGNAWRCRPIARWPSP
jgi:UDP-N-acetylmuramoyl-L-alanyl-D-glutamate--2,6-diaminopimelate ligase